MSDLKPIETVLRKRFARIRIVESKGSAEEEHLVLQKEHLIPALNFLMQDPDTHLDYLLDLSAVHYLDASDSTFAHAPPGPFFEVYYLLRSVRLNYLCRISVLIDQQMPSMPSVCELYKSATWLEREMWDLFGVFVEGHPDLRRLLMTNDFNGHPLSKNYVESFQR